MQESFDIYIIHPSAANCAEAAVSAILSFKNEARGRAAVVFAEAPENLLGNRLLKNSYPKLLTGLAKSVEVKKLYSACAYDFARKAISKGSSVRLISFPYQALRSLCKLAAANESGAQCIAINFDGGHTETADLRHCDPSFAFTGAGIKPSFTFVDAPANIAACRELRNIKALDSESTLTSKIYTFDSSDKNEKCVFKTLKPNAPITDDYLLKINNLIRLRELFTANRVPEALPQKVVKDACTNYGIISNYIDGVPLDYLSIDVNFSSFMKKCGYRANMVNRIYILIKLCLTICTYHSVGLYLSDIKGNNFIVSKSCDVIPIDSDGFSFGKFYSSPPVREMMKNPTEWSKNFLATEDDEIYSTAVMIYKFLMQNNRPHYTPTVTALFTGRQEFSQSTRGRLLAKRWDELPSYLQKTLFECIAENKPHTIEYILRQLIRFYGELTNQSESENSLFKFVKSEVRTESFRSTASGEQINLDRIKLQKLRNSFT